MSSKVAACPFCDTHRIYVNSGSDMHDWRDAPPYRCRECKRGFDEPNRRAAQNNQASQKPSGLAGRLADADPDEVSG